MQPLLRLFAGLITLLLGSAEAAQPRLEAAIVVDAASGHVLIAQNADAQVYPASLTKMMTLYMLFAALQEGRLALDDWLPVSPRAASMPPSHLGLRAGERIRVEDAIRALIVKSANDVAVVVAEALAGSEAAFAEAMTRKARALGMTRTTFVNASGLADLRQRTTVRDLAILARRLIADYPRYYHYFATERFSWKGRVLRTHNGLIGSYSGADGLKTGFIRASGYNLAASAVRGGRRIIAVYVGGRTATQRNRAVAQLLDRGFKQLASAPILAALPSLARPAGPQAEQGHAAAPTQKAFAGPLPNRLAAVENTAPWRRPAVHHTVAALPKSYSVQVGAYRRPADANQAARMAIRRFPDQLLGRSLDIVAKPSRRKPLYQVRFAGFAREEAEEACAVIRQQLPGCLIVRYEAPIRVAAR